jgi:predicted negative regulator of RcsB-dependent stress response
MINFRRINFYLLLMILLSMVCKAVFAGPKDVDKLRKFYREHNLDFFGEMIADESNFLEDEKKHAKLELLADDARTRALNQLENLLRNARGDMQAELLIRKATLFGDRARTASYFQNNPFKASKLKPPKTYLEQSISAFMDVEKRFAGHPKMDIVIFSIAYNYGELRDVDNSYKYYSRLVQKFPGSPLVGDARLAMAEILFDKRKFAESLGQLKEIVKSDHPRLKNFALYKMAWTYYNMSDLDSAMVSLEKVIDGVNSASGVARARLELRKEALNDLVSFYSERPDPTAPSKAKAYFEKMGHTPESIAKEYEQARAKKLAAYKEKKVAIPDEDADAFQITEPQELLLRLTKVYRDQGKHEQSMVIADALIGSLGRHPKTPPLYRLRAESAEKLRKRDLVVEELRRIAKVAKQDLPVVSSYDSGLPELKLPDLNDYFANLKIKQEKQAAPKFTDPELVKAPKDERDPYQKALALTALEAFRDFTNYEHGEWLKTSNADAAKSALALYDLAIDAMLLPWRGHPIDQCFELRNRRAQLRYALKQWDGAAEDFHWLVHHSQAGAHGKESDKNSRNDYLQGEIASLEGWLKEQPVKIKKGDFHPIHARLESAYDSFLSFHLFDAKKRQMTASTLAASAGLFKDYGKSEQALHRMLYYSRYLHDQKDASPLTSEVLSILQKASRWEELRDYSALIIELGYYKNFPVAKELSHSNEFASLRLLEHLEKDKDWSKAAKEFAVFAQKNPESPFVSQALMKSANAALELKDVKLTIERLEKATKAPDEKVRLQAWLGLEPYYRKAFQWKKVRALYEAVLTLKPDAKLRDGTLKNLKSLRDLDASLFATAREDMLNTDPDLEAALSAQDKFERSTAEFREMRFVKSNNNPAQNFKKKADLFAKLTSQLDKTADKAPKSFKGEAALWANIIKAELILEFAGTLTGAALPTVLKAATDADRKAYVDTLAGQAKDLREQAMALIKESAKFISQIDSPAILEPRLNKLLEIMGDKSRFAKPDFAPIWAKRPSLELSGKERPDDERCFKLGQQILLAEKKEDMRQKTYELARYYLASGETGYAYATAAELVADQKDEWSARAARLQYEVDQARLPQKYSSAMAKGELSPQMRWDIARWIAGNGNLAKQLRSKSDNGFSENEIKWFEEATVALLRARASEVGASPQKERGIATASQH